MANWSAEQQVIDTSYVFDEQQPKPITFRGRGRGRQAAGSARGSARAGALTARNDQQHQAAVTDNQNIRGGNSGRGGRGNRANRGGYSASNARARGGHGGGAQGVAANAPTEGNFQHFGDGRPVVNNRYRPYPNAQQRPGGGYRGGYRGEQPTTPMDLDDQFDANDYDGFVGFEHEYQQQRPAPNAFRQQQQQRVSLSVSGPSTSSNIRGSQGQTRGGGGFANRRRATTPRKYQNARTSTNPSDVDRSCFGVIPQVHLPAAYVQTMKDYRRYMGQIEIVVDMYGSLASEVRWRELGRIEFTLRDRTGTQLISYYPIVGADIDEPFPPIEMGAYMKVICLWRHWGLQAVKVAAAEPDFATKLEGRIRVSAMALRQKLELASLV